LRNRSQDRGGAASRGETPRHVGLGSGLAHRPDLSRHRAGNLALG